ncbi:MAG: O-antigen ligase family protein [Hydrogenophaga sp.]|uniref:O-antigen ligase family protein n=1 Tax=Hydrogenophaga sp. TaxID=1904254 RepID=UPI002730A6E0|nr:O-antigen ligase family protein [Hydrogenophaga sp.]MDP2163245.1 O-antigen ligase family protein [Hydrogenophaga sp.]
MAGAGLGALMREAGVRPVALAPADRLGQTLQGLALGAGVLLIVCAPLMRGGNRSVALVALEWLGLAVLLGVGLRGLLRPVGAWGHGSERLGLLVLAAAPLWVALVQLLPLPMGLWTALPGRAFYLDVLAAVQAPGTGWRPASLTPDATWAAVLAGIPLVACFALALASTPAQLKTLTRVWIGGALAQALLGLAQLGPFPALHFDSLFTGVIGTFANRNHFTSFLVMTLPLVVLELRGAWQHRPHHPGGVGHAGWLWGVVLFVLVLAVLAAGSRAGIATGVLVTLATVLLLPGPRGSRLGLPWRLGALAALVLLALGAVGLDWMGRFAGQTVAADSAFRHLLATSTWTAALEFWPLGSGLGSYAGVFPRFQPAEVSGFAPHAHSDYVQLLMECGLLFVGLAAVALWLLGRRARGLAARARTPHGLDRQERLMMVCGLGLLALLLHAWVDFNLRIPANAMLGAFLLGALLRPLGGGDHPSPPARASGRERTTAP